MPSCAGKGRKVLQTGFNSGFDKVRQGFFLWIVVEKLVDTVDKSVDN